MTTCADLIQQAKTDYLLAGVRDQRNKLAAAYTAAGTTLTMTYDLGNIKQGATLAIGLNVFYVWAADPVTKVVTVQGGFDGSTDVNAANGAEVIVNPRYTDFQIFRALNQTVAAISSPAVGLFRVVQGDFAYSGAVSGYPLTGITDLPGIVEIRYVLPGYDDRVSRLSRSSWRLERTEGATDSFTVRLFAGSAESFGQTLTILYKAGFATFTATTTTTASISLPDSMIDILPMGAALRLLNSKEIQRNDLNAQGSGRKASEVPPGAAGAAPNWLRRQYADRIHEEAARLASLYPLTR